MRRLVPSLLAFLSLAAPSRAHEIPNARVDRSTQVTVRPGVLRIDYEVSLSELTLTQDLRALIGSVPGGDREDWFARYGREVGPLNAKGFLISVDGEPLDLRALGYDLSVEEHPRYVFHCETSLPAAGDHLVIRDTNYATRAKERRAGSPCASEGGW